jgi:hypothetical protein
VVRFTAPIDPPLRRYLERLARDRALPIAEINRRVGERSESSGGRRPSYAAVRLLVRAARLRQEEPSWLDLYLRVAYAHESPEIFVDKKLGLLDRHLPEDYGLRNE